MCSVNCNTVKCNSVTLFHHILTKLNRIMSLENQVEGESGLQETNPVSLYK